MNCPKCAGLLIQEEITVLSGRFQGWRCIQCGLRLDEIIVQNRVDVNPDELDDSEAEPSPALVQSTGRAARPKRAAGKS
jgi:hypothetical protein